MCWPWDGETGTPEGDGRVWGGGLSWEEAEVPGGKGVGLGRAGAPRRGVG